MPNSVYIDEEKRHKQPEFAGCFFKSEHYPNDTWMGIKYGACHMLVSLERGILLTSPTPSLKEAFGDNGQHSFEQITSTITIVPKL